MFSSLTIRAKSGTVHRRAGLYFAPLGIWVQAEIDWTVEGFDRLLALVETPGIEVQIDRSMFDAGAVKPNWIAAPSADEVRQAREECRAELDRRRREAVAESDLTGAWAKGFSIDGDIAVDGIVTDNHQNTEEAEEVAPQAATEIAAPTAESQNAPAATSDIPSQTGEVAGQEQTAGENPAAAPVPTDAPQPAAKETAPKPKRPKA